MWERLNDHSDTFSFWLGRILSWSIWVPAIIAISALGLFVFHWSDGIIMILTVQTAVDAAATKTMQNVLREHDTKRVDAEEKRDKEWREYVDGRLEALTEKDTALFALCSRMLSLLEDRNIV